MSRRGLAGWLVDFYALGLLVLYVIIMLFVFKFAHSGFDRDITSSVEGTAAWITCKNLLNTEVGYMDGNATLGDLISFIGAWQNEIPPDYIHYQIIENLTVLAGRLNIYNVALTASHPDREFLKIESDAGLVCEQRQALAVLPPANPGDNRGITVMLRYCPND